MDAIAAGPMAISAHRQLNRTTVPYPSHSDLKELFERCAERFPDVDAVIHRDRTLSYRMLNGLANALASRLRVQGVKPGSVVGVDSDRSPEMIAALIAAIKCGAAYLPFDREWPQERLREMFSQSGCEVLLADRADSAVALAERLPGLRVMAMDGLPALEGGGNPVLSIDAGATAYINFTSGSTGRPKGVLIQHRSVVRLVFGARYASLGRFSRLLQLAPVTFDAATFEIWGALLHGGTCVLYPSARLRLSELKQVVETHGVTTLFLTTALFNTVVDEAPETLDRVERILTGGEAHSLKHIGKALLRYGTDRVTSVYGPTECTTFATYYPVRELRTGETALPIGQPIQNTRAYVVNENGLCEPGETGEILLAGPGLSPGYLKLPDLTLERFPTCQIDGVAERLYRTGDRALLRDDGMLVFQGRWDDQVKVNGYRIELSEIAHHLDQHADVRQSFVTIVENAEGEKSLVAFIVPDNDRCAPALVRDYLRSKIPAYMIPADIRLRDSLPLSPAGKISRSGLLSPADGGA